MEEIKDTLKKVLAALEAKKTKSQESDPYLLLKKILTKKEIGHIKVNNFRQGVLYIKVDSSSRLYFFSLRKEDLLEKLRRDLKELKNIRFVLGEIK
jgi:hypothetical protein